MADGDAPRTRLEQVLRQRRLTVDEFRKQYEKTAKTGLSARQAYRWVAGDIARLPYPQAQTVLETMLGEPVKRLFGPPYGTGTAVMGKQNDLVIYQRGTVRDDWEGQVIAMCADRARNFLSRAEASNVGAETIDQLRDDVRHLVIAYQQQPLESLLANMADTQDRAFRLLEGRQKPSQTRELYLLAAVASGLMAKASHDFGASHDAMTQARAAYACAENIGHLGLQAWTRGLQALIAYWAGRFTDSVRYAHQGTKQAALSRGTAKIWLAASEARSLSALGKMAEAHVAVDRAIEARERAEPDELDELGGLCTFNLPRQLYYAADALAWGGKQKASYTEQLAKEALNAYELAPAIDRAFGDESGTRCALAIARVLRDEPEGASEALAPVLALPTAQRIHGIVVSVANVRAALQSIDTSDNRAAKDLCNQIDAFGAERLALPPSN